MGNEFAFKTALGWIEIGWTAQGLRTLSLFAEARAKSGPAQPTWVEGAVAQITGFLAGEPADLGSIPLDLEGLSPFARSVLVARRGEALTYGQLARMAGFPGASRAVGQVMARNPLPILMAYQERGDRPPRARSASPLRPPRSAQAKPRHCVCHRVIAANGPGGFSLFGSLETKERLMALECAGR